MFNDNQKQIIDYLKGCLLALAPVSTGKTLTLAERAANAIANSILLERIFCLIFTNRAAKEMSEAILTGKPYRTRLDPPPGPPVDAEGNFIPLAKWDKDNWPVHIHRAKE